MTNASARSTPASAISRERVGQERVPVPVAPVDRQVDAVGVELGLEGRDQRADLAVDRADAAEVLVVMRDLLERLEEVAHHYALFEGVSPIDAQNRALIDALSNRARRPRHRAAHLLRQPQLEPVPRPTPSARWPPTASSARLRSSRPRTPRIPAAVSTGRTCSTPSRRSALGPGGAADALVLQPSGLDRGERRSRSGGARAGGTGRTSTSPSRPTRSHSRWLARAATTTSCASRPGSWRRAWE